MSRNGSGQYSLPVNSWNPAVNGVSATAADWQSLIDDVETALTASLAADGQTPVTGNLAMGSNKLTGLAAGTATGNSLRWEQLFSQGVEADLASATTTDIGAQNTNFLRVTGTTTITSFGTNYNGPRFLRFAGALTLTHGSALVLPGAANITTVAGDSAIVVPIATAGTADGWRVFYQRYSVSSALTLGTSQVTTSGTTFDYTSIPSWVRRITVNFVGVSLSGTDHFLVQLGDSGGLETSGYVASSATLTNAAATVVTSSTAGFIIGNGAAALVHHGSMTLTLADAANTWVSSHALGRSDGLAATTGGGSKALSATLDRIRILASGANTFDAGAVNIIYE